MELFFQNMFQIKENKFNFILNLDTDTGTIRSFPSQFPHWDLLATNTSRSS